MGYLLRRNAPYPLCSLCFSPPIPWGVPLVKVALLGPCRTEELLQMRRDDLDLFNNTIPVRCGVMKNKEMAAWKPIPLSMREHLFPSKRSANALNG